jgi:hypothetical protein
MAIATNKSTAITNQDADPRVAPTAGLGAAAVLKQIDGLITPDASLSATSKLIFARIPSNAIVKDVFLESGAQGGSAALDVGVYYASDAKDCGRGVTPGAVIDADYFASAVVVSSEVEKTNIVGESNVSTLADRLLPLWQAVGLSADPGGKLDIVGTVTTDFSGSTTAMMVDVRYTHGN